MKKEAEEQAKKEELDRKRILEEELAEKKALDEMSDRWLDSPLYFMEPSLITFKVPSPNLVNYLASKTVTDPFLPAVLTKVVAVRRGRKQLKESLLVMLRTRNRRRGSPFLEGQAQEALRALTLARSLTNQLKEQRVLKKVTSQNKGTPNI